MYQRARALVLHWLKVPPEPHPPAGAPASLRVFRAGKNYLYLRLAGWAVPQFLALVGIVFWTVVFVNIETTVRTQRQAHATGPAPTLASAVETLRSSPSTPSGTTPRPASDGKPARKKIRVNDWAAFKQTIVNFALLLPPWSFPLIWLVKIGGIFLYLAQIPLTYAVRRLDYEMRWYVVTDRSLRIRTGVWQVQELTMSFANLQQVVVTQGPLQRALGLADVRVQSAGGGGGGAPGHAHGAGDSLHAAMFHSVENATEIRDLILERLRVFRATGLGDPDDLHRESAHPVATSPSSVPAAPFAGADTLSAAHELLAEARALRQTLVK